MITDGYANFLLHHLLIICVHLMITETLEHRWIGQSSFSFQYILNIFSWTLVPSCWLVTIANWCLSTWSRIRAKGVFGPKNYRQAFSHLFYSFAMKCLLKKKETNFFHISVLTNNFGAWNELIRISCICFGPFDLKEANDFLLYTLGSIFSSLENLFYIPLLIKGPNLRSRSHLI